MSTEKVESRSFIDVTRPRFSVVKNVADPSETTRRRASLRREIEFSASRFLRRLLSLSLSLSLGDLE